jgi:hypothetical protein
VVLFSNRMDALFYKYGFPDLGRILANAVRLGLGESQDLEVDAPDRVDVTRQAQPGRHLVHLINFAVGKHLNTGWRHPGRTLVPVEGIGVRLRLAPGQTLRAVRTATDEAVLPHRMAGDWAEVTVPRLDDHEIVVFELDA